MKLIDYNRCPSCGVGEVQFKVTVDVCSSCGHTIRVPTTTELWLTNLDVGEEVFITGHRFEKIETTGGKKYWQGGPGNAWYTSERLVHTFGYKVEVKCAS